jgi:hypothetical protein
MNFENKNLKYRNSEVMARLYHTDTRDLDYYDYDVGAFGLFE